MSADDARQAIADRLGAMRASAASPSLRDIRDLVNADGGTISYTTVGKILNGERLGSGRTIAAIARALGGSELEVAELLRIRGGVAEEEGGRVEAATTTILRELRELRAVVDDLAEQFRNQHNQ